MSDTDRSAMENVGRPLKLPPDTIEAMKATGMDTPAMRAALSERPLDGRRVKFYESLGPDGRYIVEHLLGEWTALFAQKASDYNDNQNENHRVLGVRGQFADIWRKIGKLKKALWDGQPLISEQPREILMDLIAHCFLTIAMMDAERERVGKIEHDRLRTVIECYCTECVDGHA